MIIKIPIENLNDTASKLKTIESKIHQDITTLNSLWNSLKLEAASKKTIDARIGRAKTLAVRLAAESNRLSNYVFRCSSRFLEADRNESNLLQKMGGTFNSFFQKSNTSSRSFNLKSLSPVFPAVGLGFIAVSGIFGSVLLPWIKGLISPEQKTFLPPKDEPSMVKVDPKYITPKHEEVELRESAAIDPSDVTRTDELEFGWNIGARRAEEGLSNILNDPDTMAAIRNASEKTGVSVQNLIAMAIIESTGNKNIGTNSSGFTGLMQIGRDAASDIGIPYEDLVGFENVENNALAGAKYWNINASRLNEGIPRDPLHLFLAHNQGAGGTNQLMRNLENNPGNPPIATGAQRNNLPASYIASIESNGEQLNQRHFYNYWKGYMASIQEQIATHNL